MKIGRSRVSNQLQWKFVGELSSRAIEALAGLLIDRDKNGKQEMMEQVREELNQSKSIQNTEGYSPSLDTLDKICRILGKTPGELLFFDPSKPQERPSSTRKRKSPPSKKTKGAKPVAKKSRSTKRKKKAKKRG